VVVARAELAFWAGPYGRQPLFHHSVEDDELAVLAAAADSGRAIVFDDRIQLADGLDVLRVGGHTPGQSVVIVRTSEGPVLLASDAIHYYEECDKRMPFSSVANLVEMYAAFDTVSQLTADGRVTQVVSGHDPGTLDRLTRRNSPGGAEIGVIGKLA
jgi:glyoxylase-like metal-dependent hydrolase (beta-lactamase superfamily II)